MADPNIDIAITASADGVEDASKKAITALNKMGKEAAEAGEKVGDSFGEAGESAKKAAPAVKGLTVASDGLKDSAGETASVLGKLKSAVGLVSPEAEAALDGFQRLTDGLEGVAQGAGGMSVALPVAATAVAALSTAATIGYGVWALYTAEERLATEATIALKAALDSLVPSSQRIAELQLQEAKALGEITSAEFAFEKAKLASAAARDRDLEALIESTGVTADQLESAQRILTMTGDNTAALAGLDSAQLSAAVSANALNTGYEVEIQLLDSIRENSESADVGTQKLAKSISQQKDELVDLTKVTEEFLQLDEAKEETTFRQRITELDELQDKLEETGQLEGENIAMLDALRREALDKLLEVQDAQAEKEEEARAKKLSDAEKDAEKLHEIAVKAADAELQVAQDLAQATSQARMDAFNQIAGAADQLLQHLIDNQDTETEEGKKRAKILFNIQKGLAIATIAIDTARSIMAMLATGPAGIPLAIAAGAVGAVSIGLVAAQTLDLEGGGGGGGAAASGGGDIRGSANGAVTAPDSPDSSLSVSSSGSSAGEASEGTGGPVTRVVIDAASAGYYRELLKVGVAANPMNPAAAFRAAQIISDAGKESGAGFGSSAVGRNRAGRK